MGCGTSRAASQGGKKFRRFQPYANECGHMLRLANRAGAGWYVIRASHTEPTPFKQGGEANYGCMGLSGVSGAAGCAGESAECEGETLLLDRLQYWSLTVSSVEASYLARQLTGICDEYFKTGRSFISIQERRRYTHMERAEGSGTPECVYRHGSGHVR